MKFDKVMKCWPIAAAIAATLIGFGTLTSVVAENTKTNDKQDMAIQGIVDMSSRLQREQARTNGALEAQVQTTQRDVEQILEILLEGHRRTDHDDD